MSEPQSETVALDTFISTEIVPKLIGLHRYGVYRLEVDLTAMNIRLLVQRREEPVHISLTSIPLTTDPPEAS